MACLLALAIGMVVSAPTSADARPMIALVLGGGSAQGYNHVGALKALEEEGIPVDLIVGSSMGSVIGGLYSAGFSSDNLFDVADRVELNDYFSPIVPPRGGLLDARQLELLLDRLTNGAHFDDLEIPFYAVTTELTTGEEVALHEGSLARAIIASMSIPGLFPPVSIDGRHFVDGGLKNAVPVNVARSVGADIVIAVDVRESNEAFSPDNILNNVQMTLRFMIEGYAAQHLSSADVVVRASLEQASSMDFNRMKDFVARGYTATKKTMPQIRQVILDHDPDFPFHAVPRARGLTQAELDTRITAAHRAARLPQGRYAVSFHPSFHPDFRFRGGVSYRLAETTHSPFLRWEFAGGSDHASSYHGLRWYLGECRVGPCASLGVRKYRSESYLSGGTTLHWPIGTTYSAELDWEAGQPGATWRARVEAHPESWAQLTEHTYGFEVGRDPRGLSGPAGTEPYVQLDGSWRIALTRYGIGLGEVLQLHPALLLGAEVSGRSQQRTLDWQGAISAGIGLETRLYGLYGNQFRIESTYHPESNQWSVALRFGE